MSTIVTRRNMDEDTLRQRIKQLKKREKRLREERHTLEAELRNKIFQRYKKMSEELD